MNLLKSKYTFFLLIFAITLASCNNEENELAVQEFDSCQGQDFAITAPDPSHPWTPNAITLMSEQLADGIFAIYDERGANPDLNNYPALATSAGFVIGENGVFMIESMANRQLLCQVFDLIRAQTDLPILYVGNTNSHFDHSFGNAFLPEDVQVVQHEGTVAFNETRFEEEQNFALGIWGTEQGLQEATPRPADVAVDDNGWSVDLGGITVEAKYFGFGQTDGDLFFYVPERRVMWTGNSQLSEAPGVPWLLEGGAMPSLATMAAVRDFLPEDAIIVPGHGRPTSTEALDFTVDYLETLISEVQNSIDAGNDLEATQAAVRMTEFQGYSLWDFVHTTVNIPNTFNDLQ